MGDQLRARRSSRHPRGATIEAGTRIGANATIEESVAVRGSPDRRKARRSGATRRPIRDVASERTRSSETSSRGERTRRSKANATSSWALTRTASGWWRRDRRPGAEVRGARCRRATTSVRDTERAGGRRHRHPGGVPHRPRRGRRTRREAGDRGHRSKPAQRYAQEHESSGTAACRPRDHAVNGP